MLHMHFSRDITEMLDNIIREINYYYEVLSHRPEVKVFISKLNHYEPIVIYKKLNYHKIVINIHRIADVERELTRKAFYVLRMELFNKLEHFAPHYLFKLYFIDKRSLKKVEELKEILLAPFEHIEDIFGHNISKNDVKEKLMIYKSSLEKRPTLENYLAYKKFALIYSWIVLREHRNMDVGLKTCSTLLDSVLKPYNREFLPSLYYYKFVDSYSYTLEPEYFSSLIKANEEKIMSFASHI